MLRQAIAAGNEAGDHRLRADASLVLALVEFYADPPPDWSQRAARIATRRDPRVRAHGRRRGPGEGVARPRRRPRERAPLRPGGRRRWRGRPSTPGRPATCARSGATRRRSPSRPSTGRRPCPRRSRSARASWRTRPAIAAPRASCSAPSPISRRCAGSSTAPASSRRGPARRSRSWETACSPSPPRSRPGAVELLAGNPAEAERLIRRDVAELERMGAAYLLRPRLRSSRRRSPHRAATPRLPSWWRRACG